jgi:hypothetical protein
MVFLFGEEEKVIALSLLHTLPSLEKQDLTKFFKGSSHSGMAHF